MTDALGGETLFTYDANGNLTSDGTRTFEWDARNQLIAVNVGTHRSEFTYDGLQRRVRLVEKQDSVTQSDMKVLWCETEMCEERDGDGTTVTRRTFKQGEQVTGVARLFATDHLGSVQEVSDGGGALLARYAFDPWGRRTLAVGAEITSVGFTGHGTHMASGLALTLYRTYDAGLGRWTSSDPLGDVDGPNRYAYVNNNPLTRVDSLGLQLSWLLPGVRNKTKKGIDTAWLSCPKGDTRVFWEATPLTRTLNDVTRLKRQAEFHQKCQNGKPSGKTRTVFYVESTVYGGGAAYICCEACAS